RQRAEDNGLYFESLALDQPSPGQAMIWIAQDDVASHDEPRFDSAFLSISDPWKDERLRNWKGYTETWYFDETGSRAESGIAAAPGRRMIPLALYSLDYPRAPLLLVDFRSEWKPKRRELTLRAADSIATGVLGFNGLSNLGYFAAKISWQ